MIQATSSPSLFATPTPKLTLGLDVGDRTTHFAAVDGDRVLTERGSFATTPSALSKALSKFRGCKVALEAGSQSMWMCRALKRAGFQVQLIDPRRVQLITKDPRKTDRRDAEMIARLASAMPELLGSIHHRDEQAQADLSIIRARDGLVRVRTLMIQQVRSLAKGFGITLPAASAPAFEKRVRKLVPALLLPAVEPLLESIADTTKRIRASESLLERVTELRYPEAARLREQIRGVGPITAAAFVLSIEEPTRFDDSRKVGSWAGLCPKSFASGDSRPELGISKAGNGYLRRLLLQCAHYITGPFGKDSDLRRFGLRLIARGGSAAKKRAAVAVARKLAVAMHHVWRTGADFDPLYHAKREEQRRAV
jgi:transposase